jgi:hypothetical protein
VLTPLAAAAAIVMVVQLGGFFAWPSKPTPQHSGGSPTSGSTQEVVFAPLSKPAHGTLEHLAPTRDPIVLPPPFEGRSRRANQSGDGAISAAAFDRRMK